MIRRAVVALEQTVSARAAEAADHPTVAARLVDLGQLLAAARDQARDLRDGVVHVLALPAHRDVKALGAEVARLRATLDEVEARLDEARTAEP